MIVIEKCALLFVAKTVPPHEKDTIKERVDLVGINSSDVVAHMVLYETTVCPGYTLDRSLFSDRSGDHDGKTYRAAGNSGTHTLFDAVNGSGSSGFGHLGVRRELR